MAQALVMWGGGVDSGQSVRESRSQMKEFSLTPDGAESFRDTHSSFLEDLASYTIFKASVLLK